MTILESPAARLVVEPIHHTFGAVVHGVDARQPLNVETVTSLRRAIIDHKVVVLREQHLDLEQQIRFAEYLGEIQEHPIVPFGDYDWLWANGVQTRAEYWHSDMAFLPNPPFATILSLPVQPDTGGDTMWVDLEAAYNGLSAPVRDLLEGLEAAHYADEFQDWAFAPSVDEARRAQILSWAANGAVHPLVRTHVESGRRTLFAPAGFARKIKGLTIEESDGLLALFKAHVDRPEYHVRHRWSAGDLVIWDNRSTLHRGVNDYGTAERPLQRVTVADVGGR